MNDDRPDGDGSGMGDARSSVLVEHLDAIVATATRAPSVHNTQPWRFRLSGNMLELHADPSRRLDRADPQGREMLISCGAALFDLRLAVRKSGYRPDLLARGRLGAVMPIRSGEQRLLDATRRRHTHRGPFTAEPLPTGLPSALQRDAESERMVTKASDPVPRPRLNATVPQPDPAPDRRDAFHDRPAGTSGPSAMNPLTDPTPTRPRQPERGWPR